MFWLPKFSCLIIYVHLSFRFRFNSRSYILVKQSYKVLGEDLSNQNAKIFGPGCRNNMIRVIENFLEAKKIDFPKTVISKACDEMVNDLIKVVILVKRDLFSSQSEVHPAVENFNSSSPVDCPVNELVLDDISFNKACEDSLYQTSITVAEDLLKLDPNLKVVNVRFDDRFIAQGTVYVLGNACYKPGLYKIGFTNRMVNKRTRELYTTGVPAPFDILKEWETKYPKKVESFMHEIFKYFRTNTNREFFEAPLLLIITVGDWVTKLAAKERTYKFY